MSAILLSCAIALGNMPKERRSARELFDALVWDVDRVGPSMLTSLNIDGREPKAPSGLTYARLESNRV